MTVFALVAVHNRVADTRRCVECLRAQKFAPLRIVVVDDGSTDETARYLVSQADILTLTGDGNLWWSRAMQRGLDAIAREACDGDYVLFLNDDTIFDESFVLRLVEASLAHGDAVVGSLLVHREDPGRVLSLGPEIDFWGMRIWERFVTLPAAEQRELKAIYPMAALSGRGTLYPHAVVKHIGRIAYRLLPHYAADYEYSARAARFGATVIVSTLARTQSADDFGVLKRRRSWHEQYFARGSAENLVARVSLFVLLGSPIQRITAIPRMLWFRCKHVAAHLVWTLRAKAAKLTAGAGR